MEDLRFNSGVNKTTPARFKHFCNPGDLIASLPAMKSYYEKTGRKVILSQQLNVKSNYYPGATHGTLADNGSGDMVCMNKHIFDMIRPLVLSQEYIEDMEVYEGQEPLTVDIDVIREQVFVNLPHGSIQSWVMFAYPDLEYDLSRAWIELKQENEQIKEYIKDKIILNFTERYRNAHVSYYFLRKFKNRLIFAGTEKEYLLFCNTWGIDMPRLEVANFLDLAYAIKYCKFLLGNQSMCWGIAEAMKTPRVLEICRYAQNCMPFYGKKSYGFFHQTGLEYYVDVLTT